MMESLQPNPLSRRGVILTEAIVSIALVGLVLTMVSLLLTRYARSTDYFLNYRRAQLAAESCVERMRAGVLDVADATLTDEAGVSYEIRVTDAEGEWRPLKHVIVTASVVGKHSRTVRYRISTYLRHARVPKGGGP
ncbi:MAG: hypothetical protein ACYTFA_08515 [Planctomycetota bacterium]|jgi:hypothetical protein